MQPTMQPYPIAHGNCISVRVPGEVDILALCIKHRHGASVWSKHRNARWKEAQVSAAGQGRARVAKHAVLAS
jgi:hypothetical protein